MKRTILRIKKINITSGFGNRVHPVTGKAKMHNGVDIACPVGTPVLSPVAAIVTNVFYDDKFGGGHTVILRDMINDDRYGFCHLQKATCKIGDIIQQGQEIARSGNSGVGTGAHLHFSHSINVKWNNNQAIEHTPIDPTDKIEYEL